MRETQQEVLASDEQKWGHLNLCHFRTGRQFQSKVLVYCGLRLLQACGLAPGNSISETPSYVHRSRGPAQLGLGGPAWAQDCHCEAGSPGLCDSALGGCPVRSGQLLFVPNPQPLRQPGKKTILPAGNGYVFQPAEQKAKSCDKCKNKTCRRQLSQ